MGPGLADWLAVAGPVACQCTWHMLQRELTRRVPTYTVRRENKRPVVQLYKLTSSLSSNGETHGQAPTDVALFHFTCCPQARVRKYRLQRWFRNRGFHRLDLIGQSDSRECGWLLASLGAVCREPICCRLSRIHGTAAGNSTRKCLRPYIFSR